MAWVGISDCLVTGGTALWLCQHHDAGHVLSPWQGGPHPAAPSLRRQHPSVPGKPVRAGSQRCWAAAAGMQGVSRRPSGQAHPSSAPACRRGHLAAQGAAQIMPCLQQGPSRTSLSRSSMPSLPARAESQQQRRGGESYFPSLGLGGIVGGAGRSVASITSILSRPSPRQVPAAARPGHTGLPAWSEAQGSRRWGQVLGQLVPTPGPGRQRGRRWAQHAQLHNPAVPLPRQGPAWQVPRRAVSKLGLHPGSQGLQGCHREWQAPGAR